MEDEQLLGQYAREQSESAFGELVTRHIDLVFSAALRVVNGDSHLAQDVTQTVFADLARKARSLPRGVVVAGWLYRHSCFTAAKAVRGERRRRAREQTSMEMKMLEDNSEPDWARLAPHLDEGLNQLSAPDRDAIVLRFFKRQDLRAVGAALGVNEDTAQKRVSRALEKLRSIVGRRGVTLSAATLASTITAGAVSAAPTGLAAAVTGSSLAAAAGVGTGIGLATFKVMSITKLQIGVAGVILAAGLATPMVLQHQSLGKLRAENQQLTAQNQILSSQAQQAGALTAENARLSKLTARASQPAPGLNNQLEELLRLRSQVTRLQTDARSNANPPNPMVEMMKDPHMKDFMQSIMGTMVDKNYGKLFADLHLTPEQTAALKALILKKESAGTDLGLSMFTGDRGTEKQEELVQQTLAQRAAVDGEIKQFLGDEAYVQYQAYEKSAPERSAVSQFQDKLAGGSALNASQEQQLIQAMNEERENLKPTVDLSDKSKLNGGMSAMFSEDVLKQAQQMQEKLNQRYLLRAQSIMSREQYGAFQKFLADQQQMQNSVMQVFPKLMGTKTSGN